MPYAKQNGNTGDSKLELSSVELSFEKKTGLFNKCSLLVKCLVLGVILCCVVIIALAIVVAVQSKKDDSPDVCLTGDCANSATRILHGLDQTVKPCDNFFDFACGTWRKTNVIPEDRSSLDVFGVLRDEVEVVMKYLLEDDSRSDDLEAVVKAKDLYKSCMNESYIAELGLSVVFPLLEELGGWPVLENKPGGNWSIDNYSLTQLMLTLLKYNNNPIISMYVTTDRKNSSVRIIYIDQPGFGMPGRKYYLAGRDDIKVLAYEELMTSVAVAMGADEATAKTDAKDMVDMEMELANISMASEDRRDNNVLYNEITLSQLSVNFTEPASVRFNWTEFVTSALSFPGVNLTVSDDEVIIMSSIPYYTKLFNVLEKYGPRTISNYAVWIIMKNRIQNMDESFEELITKYNKVLYGSAVPRARWRKCTSYVNSIFGSAVGRLFVKETFNEESKKDTEAMISRLKIAFNGLLDRLDWMDTETRQSAREKADYIKQKIGFQDIILVDKSLNELYKNYTIKKDRYFGNVLAIINRISVDSLRMLRTKVDKEWWSTAPATVNAFYNSVLNRIMFPAGILQPPFYGLSQPKSMNYGGIGVVIGHEITHGFDDRGRQFDKDGNLEQWWSDSAINKFKERAQCIIDQYGNFELPEANNMNLNGINTQGENIADNGGLKQSFNAYRQWVKDNGEEPRLPGVDFTHNQIFFINFAQIWCSNMREGNAINRILTGAHSPGRYRVIGTLQNSPDFATAFNCPKGSYMNPAKKCTVW